MNPIRRMKKERQQLNIPGSPGYHLVKTKQEYLDLKSRILDAAEVSYDYETFTVTNATWEQINEKDRPLDFPNTHCSGISFAVKPGESFYLPVNHAQPTRLFTLEDAADLVTSVNPESVLIAHNAVYEYIISKFCFGDFSFEPSSNVMDTMIMAYLVDENRAVALKGLSETILDVKQPKYKNIVGTGTMADVTGEQVRVYGCADSDITLQLYHIFKAQLEELGLLRYAASLDMKIIPALAAMQCYGAPFDMVEWEKQILAADKEYAKTEAEVNALAGREVNCNSSKQVADLLYGELNLAPHHRTESGAWSTDITSLTSLWTAHPIVKPMVRNRKLKKRIGSFYNTYPTRVHPDTGCLHPQFSLITREDKGLSTGRLAGSKPNLTQIPKRGDGKMVRNLFTPHYELGHDTVATFDWSQIELRMLAYLCRDATMLHIYQNNEDIHWKTARAIFGQDVKKMMRDAIAKTVNFLIVYGGGATTLSNNINKEAALNDIDIRVTPVEAQSFIDTYLRTYPGVAVYAAAQARKAEAKGYVTSIFGRRYNLPYMNSYNDEMREKSKRKAVNSVVQGSSAELMKRSVVKIWTDPQFQLWHEAGAVRLLFLIHDELVFSLNSGIWYPLKDMVLKYMTDAPAGFDVPLESSFSTGPNFGQVVEGRDAYER